jgi:predicted RNase H-like HicB family nuclease
MTNDTNMTEETVKTYNARLEREDDGRWSIELEEEPRVHTWGRTIDQALSRMREAAALWFQTDEASIDLVPKPVLPKATAKTVEQARKPENKPATPTAWP